MKVLIQREFSETSLAQFYRKRPRIFLCLIVMTGVGVPALLWFLGPRIVDVTYRYAIVSVIGLAMVFHFVNHGLTRDDIHRQMIFLQILPVRKSDIVHAKFISVLLLCGCVAVWIGLFTYADLFIHGDGTVDAFTYLNMAMVLPLIFYISAVILYSYFLWGYRRTIFIQVFALIVWAFGFIGIGFLLDLTGKEPSMSLFIAVFVLSLVIYFICWWMSVRRVKNKGFPGEGSVVDREDTMAST